MALMARCLAADMDLHRGPTLRLCSEVSQARIKEALLLEMLDIGQRVADKKEGGCHEVAYLCIDRGGLRYAVCYGTGATRDADLSCRARERVQV